MKNNKKIKLSILTSLIIGTTLSAGWTINGKKNNTRTST